MFNLSLELAKKNNYGRSALTPDELQRCFQILEIKKWQLAQMRLNELRDEAAEDKPVKVDVKFSYKILGELDEVVTSE